MRQLIVHHATMLRSSRRLAAVTALPALAIIAQPSSRCDEEYELATRLKTGLNVSNLRLRKEHGNGDLRTYSVRTANFGKGGLPLCRVATVEVGASVEEVSALLENASLRRDWDPAHTSESRVVPSSNVDASKKLNYTRGKAGTIVPARDFVVSTRRHSPAILSINNFNSVVILNTDASSQLPTSWRAVRGRQNSCYVLEPLSSSRTLVTYMVEMGVGGWAAWLDNATVDLLAGDSMLLFLLSLKRYVEAQQSETAKMTVDEAARTRFQRQQRAASEQALVDDWTVVSKADQMETVKLLERRLSELGQQERKEGLDLSELRKKMQADLQTAREKARRA